MTRLLSGPSGAFGWVRVVLVAGFASGLLVACAATEETGETNESLNDDVADVALDETWDAIDAQLSTLEDQLVALREEIDEAGEQAQAEWNLQVAELEERTENLREDMDELGDDTAEAWDEFADRAGDAMSEIRDGIAEIGDDVESSLG